jgi:hypothetical protein
LDSFVDVSVSQNDALRAVRSRSMKTSAAARSSGDDCALSFNNRMPDRSGRGALATSAGLLVHVRRSSSHLIPIAFIFSACSGVTSRAEAACRGVDRVWWGTTNAAAVQHTNAALTRRMLTSSTSSDVRIEVCSVYLYSIDSS